MEKNLIILAEDDPRQRGEFVKMFESLGFEVRSFEDGQFALEALHALSPADMQRAILVTDCDMPRMKGRELATAVRGQGLDIPVMMWTKNFDPDAEEEFMLRAGADYASGKIFYDVGATVALNATLEKYAQRVGKPPSEFTLPANPGRSQVPGL